MKKILIFLMIIVLTGCSSSVQAPAWQNKAASQLEEYKINFLTGKETSSEPHFARARKEISSGNDLNLLAIAYLTKYALHTACLESFDSVDFARLYRLEPNPANMAYCHFLKGNFSAVDAGFFPARYAGVLKAALSRDASAGIREISLIDDSFSRLVACGVWVRYLPVNEDILLLAISTASAAGWQKPLFAYLAKLQTFYTERGEAGKAEAVRLRLEILQKQ